MIRFVVATAFIAHTTLGWCAEPSNPVTQARMLLVAARETLSRVNSLSCRSHLTIDDPKSLGTTHQFHSFDGQKYRVEVEFPTPQKPSASRMYAFDGREYRYFEDTGNRVGYGFKTALTQIPAGPWQWSLRAFLSKEISSGPPYALKESSIWDHWSALVVDAQPEQFRGIECLRMDIHIPNGAVSQHWLSTKYNGFIVKSVGYNPEGLLVLWAITDKSDVVQIDGRDFLFPRRVLSSMLANDSIDEKHCTEFIVDEGYRINDPDPSVSYTIDSSHADVLYNMDTGIMDFVTSGKRLDTNTMQMTPLVNSGPNALPPAPVAPPFPKDTYRSPQLRAFLWLNLVVLLGVAVWGIRRWVRSNTRG